MTPDFETLKEITDTDTFDQPTIDRLEDAIGDMESDNMAKMAARILEARIKAFTALSEAA